MLKISQWDNKVIFNSVDAKLNNLNNAGKALKQPLSLQSRESSQKPFLVKSLPIYRNRNQKKILICPAPDHQQEIVSLSEKEERNKQISLLIFLVDWNVKDEDWIFES